MNASLVPRQFFCTQREKPNPNPSQCGKIVWEWDYVNEKQSGNETVNENSLGMRL